MSSIKQTQKIIHFVTYVLELSVTLQTKWQSIQSTEAGKASRAQNADTKKILNGMLCMVKPYVDTRSKPDLSGQKLQDIHSRAPTRPTTHYGQAEDNEALK